MSPTTRSNASPFRPGPPLHSEGSVSQGSVSGRSGRSQRWGRGWLSMAVFVLCASPVAAAGSGAPGSGAGILRRAFAVRYDCPLAGIVEITTRRGEMQAVRRRVEVATKQIAGRLHTYARFREPPYLRGMAFLAIEARDPTREDERFVYLPSLGRVRRVGGSQSSDAFLGTDLSQRDFERQRGSEYRVECVLPLSAAAELSATRACDASPGRGGPSGEALGGQAARGGSRREEPGSDEARWELHTRPLRDTGYTRIDWVIAQSDYAILGTRYHRSGRIDVWKELRMPRRGIRAQQHCRIPSQILVRDPRRGTRTRLVVEPMVMGAAFPDSLFSLAALQASHEIPVHAASTEPGS